MAYTNPNGVANALADVTATLTSILDETFQQASKTSMWTPNPALVQGFQNAKTGKIATVAVSGLGNYDQSKGFPEGLAAMTLEDYVLRYDRGVSYLLDQVDVMQSAGIPTASAVLAEFSRSQLVPEVDAVRIATVASKAITGNVSKDYTPAKATILSEFMDALAAIENATGIDGGINILVNQKYGNVLRASTEITRTKDMESSAATLNNKVMSINDNPVTYVPSARMHTAFDLKAGTAGTMAGAGFAPASTAQEIVALFTAPDCAHGVVAHNIQKIIPPEINQTADGTKLAFRVYHDCIVPNNKVPGIYALLVPAPVVDSGAGSS